MSTAPRAPRRRRHHTLPLAALLVGLMVWFWAIVLSAAPADPLPVTSASGFVPADATRASVTFTQGELTGNGMVENARFLGAAVIFGMSVPAARTIERPDTGFDGMNFWREATIPADQDQPTRYRIRTVDADGIHLRVQDWQQLGVSFDNLLELPADVHAGSQWSSSGRALADPISRQLHFSNTSRAAAAADGCLQVDSDTTLTADDNRSPLRWQEQNLWCPGLGVSAETGTFREASYAIESNRSPLGSIAVDSLQTPAFDASARAAWTHRSSPIVAGDQTFGADEHPETDVAARPLVAANGVVAFPYVGTNDLVMLLPLDTGSLWQHWFGRPGGAITAATVVGSVVVVATTDRTLLAYNAGGRLRWASGLDDVAVAAPVALGPTRLAVATVGGTLTVLDTTTSLPVWSTSTPNAVHSAIVGNETAVVVTDTDGNLTAYASGDGTQLWSAEVSSPFGSALAIDGDTVFVTAGGFVNAQDLRTGRLRWSRHVGGTLGGLARAGDQLLVENNGAIEAWSPAEGSSRWRLADATLAAADLGGCLAPASGAESAPSFLLGPTAILAVDDDGRIERRWSVAAPAATERSLHCADGRVWLAARSSDGSRDFTVESVGPP